MKIVFFVTLGFLGSVYASNNDTSGNGQSFSVLISKQRRVTPLSLDLRERNLMLLECFRKIKDSDSLTPRGRARVAVAIAELEAYFGQNLEEAQ